MFECPMQTVVLNCVSVYHVKTADVGGVFFRVLRGADSQLPQILRKRSAQRNHRCALGMAMTRAFLNGLFRVVMLQLMELINQQKSSFFWFLSIKPQNCPGNAPGYFAPKGWRAAIVTWRANEWSCSLVINRLLYKDYKAGLWMLVVYCTYLSCLGMRSTIWRPYFSTGLKPETTNITNQKGSLFFIFSFLIHWCLVSSLNAVVLQCLGLKPACQIVWFRILFKNIF